MIPKADSEREILRQTHVSHVFHHMSYFIPKNALKYLSCLYLGKMGTIAKSFVTPMGTMAWGQPTCNTICCRNLPE